MDGGGCSFPPLLTIFFFSAMKIPVTLLFTLLSFATSTPVVAPSQSCTSECGAVYSCLSRALYALELYGTMEDSTKQFQDCICQAGVATSLQQCSTRPDCYPGLEFPLGFENIHSCSPRASRARDYSLLIENAEKRRQTNQSIGIVAVLVIFAILLPLIINCARIFSILFTELYREDEGVVYYDVESNATSRVALLKPAVVEEDLPRYLPRYEDRFPPSYKDLKGS